jgi:succinyl-diaminopimelate desuccinylase
VAWLKLTASGESAHGAYPWRGENAILKMTEFIKTLNDTFPNPSEEQWVSTMNVSIIETNNTAYNKVPDHCSIVIDVRFIPEDAKAIIEKINSILPAGITMEIIANEPALNTDENLEFVAALKKSTEKIFAKRYKTKRSSRFFRCQTLCAYPLSWG